MPAKRDVAERCAVIINSFSRIQPAILRAVRLLSLPFGAASRAVHIVCTAVPAGVIFVKALDRWGPLRGVPLI